ncbi:MAG: fructosamine kinase family protein [Pseudomonadota bacterium]
MPDWPTLAASLAENGVRFAAERALPVAGGDIAAAWRVDSAEGPVFLKTLPVAEAGMLEAECEGLAALADVGAVRVPEVLAQGASEYDAWLALEWLDLQPLGTAAAEKLGTALAALHRSTSNSSTCDRYGWHRDNTIGRTPQPNPWSEDWVGFFREQRLRHQLALAAARGFGGRLARDGQALCERLPRLFSGYAPQASLLHGDLWSGNAGEFGGEPVIYDPAVYYGDRESDLAMTRLFGGYPAEFYSAYRQAWPLDDGYGRREALYQLYHVLNHLNLFGSGYLRQAESLLARLLQASAPRRK